MMSDARISVDYDTGLRQAIQEIFIKRIVPGNFYILIHKHDPNVLTNSDIDRIRLNLDKQISQENNMDILNVMTKYKGWFECLLKVVGDPCLKQNDLVEVFQKLKNEFDDKWNLRKRNLRTAELNVFDIQNDEGDLAIDGGPRKASNIVTNNRSTLEHLSLNNNDDLWYFENGKGRCNVCDVELTSEQLRTQHLAGQKHKKKAGQWSNKILTHEPKCLDENRNDVESDFVLPIKGEQDVGAVAGAVAGAAAVGEPNVPSNNTNNITNTLEHLSLNNNDGQWSFENGKGRCNVCEIELTSLEHKIQHLAGQKHSKKAGQWSNQLISQSDVCRTPKEKGTPSDERSSTTQSTFQDLQKNQSFCEICRLALTSPEHAGQHYAGKNHNKRVEQEKQKNTVVPQITSDGQLGGVFGHQENGNVPGGSLSSMMSPFDLDRNGLGRCRVCDVAFTSPRNADDHLKGKSHAKKMKAWDSHKPL
ncbi:unnamed protein product [Lymnaea stagnalis]|uniref:C2H2-type domain-containing protein n=1 Tax=Lymnaea stagnalis TaxID=6523 RepID=A0AAV2IMP8_LYMST